MLRQVGILFSVMMLLTCGAGSNMQAQESKTLSVSGSVRDSASGRTMRFVTVRVEGSKYGAITSAEGRYLLRLPAGRYRLRFSYVGYEPVTRNISGEGDSLQVDVVLRPAVVEAPAVVVRMEDPGVTMMREALQRKMRQRDSLHSYRYTLYTKFVASADTLTAGRVSDSGRDTTIVGIFESYSTGFYEQPDRYFNEIFQRRQSANVPPSANFVAFGTNLNAYDDYLHVVGEDIATPFHPYALDYYDFVWERRIRVDSIRAINRIRMTPRSGNRKLFSGKIYLDAEGFFPLRVEMAPNEAVQLPFGAAMRYEQTFEEFDRGFVMPSGMRIQAWVEASFLWIFDPRIDINIETIANDYSFNIPLDDGLFQRRRVEISDAAQSYDSSFWFANALLPLRADERKAYSEIQTAIDNPDSLENRSYFDRIFGPINRTLSKLNRKPFTGIADVFSYNRITGARLGLGMTGFLTPALEATAKLGYGSADQRWYGDAQLNLFADDTRRFAIEGSLFRRLERRDDPYVVNNAAITPLALLTRNDYGDYFYSEGFQLGLSAGAGQMRFIRRDQFVRPSKLRVFLRQERHSNARSNTDFAFFGSRDNFRANPAIVDGTLRSLNAELTINFSPERRISDFGLQLKGELADPDLLPGDFSFERYEGILFWRTPTLPLWQLDLRLQGGFARGNIPPQRYFSLESSVSATAATGAFRGMDVKEYYGDRYVALFLEHNFGEVVPGILRIPNVAALGLEFILLGNIGWTDFSESARRYFSSELPTVADTDDEVYCELGLGVNKLLLFFRTDITARLSQRQNPQFFFTISRATF